MEKVACIIPSRFASTRLPGKPLKFIAGKTLIERVYKQAIKAKIPQLCIVAMDHKDIEKEVLRFGGKVIMTSTRHPTGTDRLAEVARKYPDYNIIVNVQGDEPFINPDIIDRLATCLMDKKECVMATVATPLKEEEYKDSASVKVVVNQKGEALYFSRSLIPYPRNAFVTTPLKHVGIYAYRKEFLLNYANMAQTPLEKTESLEQLRVLEMGYRIAVVEEEIQGIGIDTEADLIRANSYFKKEKI